MKLHPSLEEDYIIEDGVVRSSRAGVTVHSDYLNKDIEVAANKFTIMAYESKDEPGLITRCVKRIKYAWLLKLKEENSIKLEPPEILRRPDTEPESSWGVCLRKIADSDIIGVGEVSNNTLGELFDYPFTLMIQRATANALSIALGFYSEDFYTESDDLKAFTGEKVVNYEDIDVSKENFKGNKPNKKNREEKPKINNNLSINKINLLSSLIGDIEDDILLNIQLALGKGTKADVSLEKLNEEELNEVLKSYEKRFEDDNDLFDNLWDVITTYKADQGWRLPEFKKKINSELELEKSFKEPNDLMIDDVYDLIEKWKLWPKKEQ